MPVDIVDMTSQKILPLIIITPSASASASASATASALQPAETETLLREPMLW